jgi:hypothetical protein
LVATYTQSLTSDVFVCVTRIAFASGSLVVINDFTLNANLSDAMKASVNGTLFKNLLAINFTLGSSTFAVLRENCFELDFLVNNRTKSVTNVSLFGA